MDRLWVYNAEEKKICGLHSPSRTIYPEAGTKFKKSRFEEHPNVHPVGGLDVWRQYVVATDFPHHWSLALEIWQASNCFVILFASLD